MTLDRIMAVKQIEKIKSMFETEKEHHH